MKGIIYTVLGGDVFDFVKYKFFRNIYIMFLIALICIPLYLNYYARPLFYEQIIRVIQEYAIDTVRHFDASIKAKESIKKGQYDIPLYDETAERFKKDFSVYKIKVFDRGGFVVYSTDKSEIDPNKQNTNPYFLNDVRNGKIFSKIVKKKGLSKEGKVVSEVFDVIEVYVPLMEDHSFIGAIEVYYDITSFMNSFKSTGFKLFGTLSMIFFPMTVFYFFLIFKETNNFKKEEELKYELESKTLFLEKLYSSVQSGIIVVHKETLEITKINKKALEIIDFDDYDDPLIGKIVTEFIINEEYYEKCRKIKGENLAQAETVICARTRLIPVIINTSLLVTRSKKEYLIHSFIDITEIKAAEEKIKEDSEFRKIIENSIMSGIMTIDNNGVQTYINPAFSYMVGYSYDELVGKGMPYAYWAKEDTDKLTKDFRDIVFFGHTPPNGFDAKFTSKMGTHFYANVIPGPLKDDNQEVIGWVFSCSDFSEYKSIIDERELMNKQLQKIAQMDEILKTSEDLETAYEIIKTNIKNILPNTSGCLVFENEISKKLEVVSSWGDIKIKENFNPTRQQCFTMITGKEQFVSNEDNYCSGKMIEGRGAYGCIPIKIDSEQRGIIYLQHNNACYILMNQKDLILTIAEQIGSALTNIILKNRLKEEAMRDQLTHLYNRRFMIEMFKKEVEHIKRYDGKLSVLMLDIDYFKKINDTYGHDCGDYVLTTLSAHLEKFFRKSDTICRFGGEEILVILPGSDINNAVEVAERLRVDVSIYHFNYGRNDIELKISVGVTQYTSSDRSWEEIVKRADEALYEAKKTRNTVCSKI